MIVPVAVDVHLWCHLHVETGEESASRGEGAADFHLHSVDADRVIFIEWSDDDVGSLKENYTGITGPAGPPYCRRGTCR